MSIVGGNKLSSEQNETQTKHVYYVNKKRNLYLLDTGTTRCTRILFWYRSQHLYIYVHAYYKKECKIQDKKNSGTNTEIEYIQVDSEHQ